MEIQQKENETYFDYCKRLIFNRQVYDLDYAEVWNVLFQEHISSDESRKRLRGLYRFFEELDTYNEDSIEDKNLLTRIQKEKLELQKERYKFQTEKIESNRWIREQARNELFEEKFFQAIEHNIRIKVPEIKVNRQIGKLDPLLAIADCHYGKKVDIKGLLGETLNLYNIDIFEKRMWDLLEQTVYILQKNNFTHINLLNLSDSIEGILRISQLQSLQMGVIDSSIAFAEFLANWINELSKYVFVDYYVAEQGNHNEIRLLSSKKGDYVHENTEKYITKMLYYILRDNPNVKIHFPNSDMCYFNILDCNILATHGQDERNLEKSIKDYCTLYNVPIDILIAGHFHSSHEKTVNMGERGNIKYFQCPSIIGIDDFSMSIRKSSRAGADLFIIEEGKGKVCTHNILLN